ncbi:uncharacterized protein, PEP-CTERM system associated [Sphingobium faniae]|nr:uncharacterized protein, PEP-CTERM system associated [Sphingobium faniae]
MTVRLLAGCGRWVAWGVAAAMACAAPAFARSDGNGQRTDVAPYLAIDQVVLAPLKGGGDVVTYTAITAGVTAQFQSRRVEAVADVQYSHLFGWGGDFADQDIISGIVSGRINLARGLAFDAGALGTRARTDGYSGASSFGGGYSSQVYAAYAGPSYADRLGIFDVTAAYRLGYARVEENSGYDFPGAQDGRSFDDSWSHMLTGSVGVAPGVVLPVGLVASGGYSREDASQLDQRFEDEWGRLDAMLPVSPTLAVVAGVGYENIRISQRSPLLDNNGAPVISHGRLVTDKSSPRALLYDFDGMMWDVGVLWRPSHRTSLEARVGRRYGSMTYQGSFTWQGRDSSFAVVVFDGIDSFGRMITSDVAGLARTNLDVMRNPFTGDLTGCAYSPTGGGQCFNDALAGITDANFRYRGVAMQYAKQRGLWTFGIGGGYSQRKFITPSGDTLTIRGSKDENWYADTSVNYALSGRDSIGAGAYLNYFNASGGRPDVLNAGVFTGYYRTVSRRLTASAALGVDGAKGDDLDTVITAMGQLGLRYSF